MAQTSLTILLAAGEGTRMRSLKPKVLHRIAGLSLLGHVIAAVRRSGRTTLAVVVGADHAAVAEEARRHAPDAEIFTQAERRGTAHAVLAARAALARSPDDVLVIFGDTPFVRPQTLEQLKSRDRRERRSPVLGFRPRDPTGYGRLITVGEKLIAIREDRDASATERAITLCNGGLMALDGRRALAILDRIEDRNAKREFYLTDAVEILPQHGISGGCSRGGGG